MSPLSRPLGAFAPASDLINFVSSSPSVFHVADNVCSQLLDLGFEPLDLTDRWSLDEGGLYFVNLYGSALFAFSLGSDMVGHGLRLFCCHADSPGFRLKPSDVSLGRGGTLQVSSEVYGSPLLYSWFDRPLSIAGRVAIKGRDALHPLLSLVDFEQPLAVIPSLAVHLNHDANAAPVFDKQADSLPLISLSASCSSDDKGLLSLSSLLADRLVCDPDDVLSFDLFLYNAQPGSLCGLNGEFVVSPRLDDLGMVHAGLQAFCNSCSSPSSSGRFFCMFNNEEVGSLTKQGAMGPALVNIFNRIASCLSFDEQDRQMMCYNSFLVSADQCHAVHPNHPAKHDPSPSLCPALGQGLVIKANAAQKYISDADGSAVFASLCSQADVPCQLYANRNDVGGGSTLGSKIAVQLDVRGVDVGNAILAMHSCVETGSSADQAYATRAFGAFFNS